MPQAFIIDEVIRREREKQQREESRRPRIHIDDELAPMRAPTEAEEADEGPRGVVEIQL